MQMALSARTWEAKVLLLVAAAAFCTRSAQSAFLGRACLPGQLPGTGSPPCAKTYIGSGTISNTPPPPSPLYHLNAPHYEPSRTIDPSAHLFPGCTCSMDAFIPPRRRAEYRISEIDGMKGQVEVVTVDVPLANRVRCDNASLANDVAKLLHIPVKRITVTPWSWTLPSANETNPDGPPQSNYLAFLEEDHERCDCQGENGHLQGFRKVKKATLGSHYVAPDTTVMTVSQYHAHQQMLTNQRIAIENSKNLQCRDGLDLTAIPTMECPQAHVINMDSLPSCDQAQCSELCRGEEHCGTDTDLDNCGAYDIYRKTKAPVMSVDGGRPKIWEPPPSRVQMLTRDPCLVRLLREMTSHFKQSIVNFLGVPSDKVIIEPPPVQGTVGLLQVETTVNHRSENEDEVREVPMLAVRECNIADFGDLAQHLSLVVEHNKVHNTRNATNCATWTNGTNGTYCTNCTNGTNGTNCHNCTNGANGTNCTNATFPPMPLFSVLTPNISNATNVTNTTNSTARVNLVMKLHNLSYDSLAGSWPLTSVFSTVQKAAIAISGHVSPTDVRIALFPGSVVVEATITPPPGTEPDAILSFLNDTVCNDTVIRLNAMPQLVPALTGELGCDVLKLELQDPPFLPDEANRPWIAFWTVVVKEPFAQEGAWKLLQAVNHQGTDMSKLLPMTLARIPGMLYRALETKHNPNLAIEFANETRLPPPEDKAVGFALADPYNEEARLQDEMKRMQQEKQAHDTYVSTKSAEEQQKIAKITRQVALEAKRIAAAKKQFVKAARVHAQVLRDKDAVPGPDIVNFGALAEDLTEEESPYPWRDQAPRPKYFTGLLQNNRQSKQADTHKAFLS